jgi:methylene-fatty-acyl-phospholipid synthase
LSCGCHAGVTQGEYRGIGVHPTTLLFSAIALAVERLTYAGVWHRPDLFSRICRMILPSKDPVDVLAGMFVGFKVVQAVVFAAWCIDHGDGLGRATDDLAPLAAGLGLIVAGQVLSLGVFARLGRRGVFYGNRLGHDVAWCRGFPFSIVRHPQYVGTVLTIWGFFIAMRYPAPDWTALPVLETVYYVLGALAEQTPGGASLSRALPPPATAAGQPASPRLP